MFGIMAGTLNFMRAVRDVIIRCRLSRQSGRCGDEKGFCGIGGGGDDGIDSGAGVWTERQFSGL